MPTFFGAATRGIWDCVFILSGNQTPRGESDGVGPTAPEAGADMLRTVGADWA